MAPPPTYLVFASGTPFHLTKSEIEFDNPSNSLAYSLLSRSPGSKTELHLHCRADVFALIHDYLRAYPVFPLDEAMCGGLGVEKMLAYLATDAEGLLLTRLAELVESEKLSLVEKKERTRKEKMEEHTMNLEMEKLEVEKMRIGSENLRIEKEHELGMDRLTWEQKKAEKDRHDRHIDAAIASRWRRLEHLRADLEVWRRMMLDGGAMVDLDVVDIKSRMGQNWSAICRMGEKDRLGSLMN